MASPTQEGKKKHSVSVYVRNITFPAALTLRVVCDALGTIKTSWQKIGVQLGIPHHRLQEFKADDDPLAAVVDYWLQGNVTESVVPISWQSIVTALKSEHVGAPGLADKLRKKYCQLEDTSVKKGRSMQLILQLKR